MFPWHIRPAVVCQISSIRRARQIGIETVLGGTYLAIEGPQFSTFAESELYRSWNCDVIGMTNLPEAKLAREAEMCYVSIAMVTDYDCWHPEHDQVSVGQIIRTLTENATNAQKLLKQVIPSLADDRTGHLAAIAVLRWTTPLSRHLKAAILKKSDSLMPSPVAFLE